MSLAARVCSARSPSARVCSALLFATVAMIAITAPAVGAADDSPVLGIPPRADCAWHWHKGWIVKHVRRHGKIRKIVRIRHWRTCDPIKAPTGPARLGVKSYEFRFALSRASTAAGDTIAELNNLGEDPHDLNIARVDGGGATIAFGETPSLGLSSERFATEPGQYRLWCSLPGHAALGMEATLTVTR